MQQVSTDDRSPSLTPAPFSRPNFKTAFLFGVNEPLTSCHPTFTEGLFGLLLGWSFIGGCVVIPLTHSFFVFCLFFDGLVIQNVSSQVPMKYFIKYAWACPSYGHSISVNHQHSFVTHEQGHMSIATTVWRKIRVHESAYLYALCRINSSRHSCELVYLLVICWATKVSALKNVLHKNV